MVVLCRKGKNEFTEYNLSCLKLYKQSHSVSAAYRGTTTNLLYSVIPTSIASFLFFLQQNYKKSTIQQAIIPFLLSLYY